MNKICDKIKKVRKSLDRLIKESSPQKGWELLSDADIKLSQAEKKFSCKGK